ncbi:MAG: FMN-binding protein [Butyrivibrio sp.]|nr:FMN-binding protein [Butyrivibrio sp.]
MQFVISLCVVIIFVITAGEILRKNPLPFYVGAILLASLSTAFSWTGAGNLLSFITRGAFTGALFTIVMFAGAFPQGSFGAKSFMPVRAQLSILGSVFALSHGLALGKSYFLRIISGGSLSQTYEAMGLQTVLSLAVSVLLMLIMLPLFITSFKAIRKKMNPKTWKNLQRFAYLFYLLMIAHILFFEIPKAMRGIEGYAVNVFAYSLVFLSYLFCRILRYVYRQKKELMAKMQIVSVTASLLISVITVLGINSYATDVSSEIPEVAGASRGADTVENSDEDSSSGYADGTYYGEGMGNNGKIGVEVVISAGAITDISIVNFPDDQEYFDPESDGIKMIKDMIQAQSPEVDTISGATYSSEGVIDAVNAALEQSLSGSE